MFVEDNRIAEREKSASKKGAALISRTDFKALNVESLKGVLSYFSYLHAKGEISDKALEALVRYACAIFIENEVEERVQKAMERKLAQFWKSKFSPSIEEYISDIEGAVYGADISRLVRSR